MKLVIETAGVAYWLAVGVTSPQGGRVGSAVGTGCSFPLSGTLKQKRRLKRKKRLCHERKIEKKEIKVSVRDRNTEKEKERVVQSDRETERQKR